MRCFTTMLPAVFACAIALIVHAAPTDQANHKARRWALFAPYSKMSSLTDDQRLKIQEIHRKALADIKEIEAKQSSDIMALLNDEQRKELREVEDKTTADAKSKAREDERREVAR